MSELFVNLIAPNRQFLKIMLGVLVSRIVS